MFDCQRQLHVHLYWNVSVIIRDSQYLLNKGILINVNRKHSDWLHKYHMFTIIIGERPTTPFDLYDFHHQLPSLGLPKEPIILSVIIIVLVYMSVMIIGWVYNIPPPIRGCYGVTHNIIITDNNSGSCGSTNVPVCKLCITHIYYIANNSLIKNVIKIERVIPGLYYHFSRNTRIRINTFRVRVHVKIFRP